MLVFRPISSPTILSLSSMPVKVVADFQLEYKQELLNSTLFHWKVVKFLLLTTLYIELSVRLGG